MAIKNQDILRNYAGMLGRGEGDVGNVQLLIQALRQRQQDAEETDKAKLKSGVKVGKAGLQAGKSFRDFAIARLANKNLSFADFMKNPTTAAKWVKEGANMVAKNPSLMPKSFDPRIGKMGAVGTAVRDMFISPGQRAMEAEASSPTYGQASQVGPGGKDYLKARRIYGDSLDQYNKAIDESQSIAGQEIEDVRFSSNLDQIARDVTGANVSGDWKNMAEQVSGSYEGVDPMGKDKLADLTYNPQQIDVSSEAYSHIPDPSSEKRGLLERLLKKPEPVSEYVPKEYKGSITSSLLDEVRGANLGRSESLAPFIPKEPASEVVKEGAEAVGGEVASAGLGSVLGAGSGLMSMANQGATPTNTLKTGGSLLQLLGLIPGLQPLAGLGTLAKGASYGTRALDIT